MPHKIRRQFWAFRFDCHSLYCEDFLLVLTIVLFFFPTRFVFRLTGVSISRL